LLRQPNTTGRTISVARELVAEDNQELFEGGQVLKASPHNHRRGFEDERLLWT
jgi:hypothetical protein